MQIMRGMGSIFTTPNKQSSSNPNITPLNQRAVDSGHIVTHIPATISNTWNTNGKFIAMVIDDILSPEECKSWIQDTENIGYGEALVNIGGGMQRKITEVRNSKRCIVDTPDRAHELWNRVRSFLPLSAADERKVPFELNERFRFLKYDAGEYFAPHMDGNYRRERNDTRFGDVSYLTLQVYLNEGFEGGSTRFFSADNQDKYYDVVPKTGSVLIFTHRVLHSGEVLVRGRKYALRTDVMFTDKDSERAPGATAIAAAAADGEPTCSGDGVK